MNPLIFDHVIDWNVRFAGGFVRIIPADEKNHHDKEKWVQLIESRWSVRQPGTPEFFVVDLIGRGTPYIISANDYHIIVRPPKVGVYDTLDGEINILRKTGARQWRKTLSAGGFNIIPFTQIIKDNFLGFGTHYKITNEQVSRTVWNASPVTIPKLIKTFCRYPEIKARRLSQIYWVCRRYLKTKCVGYTIWNMEAPIVDLDLNGKLEALVNEAYKGEWTTLRTEYYDG